MHVHFKVHGAGKKNLHGDGIALWYTRDRLVPGRVVLAQVGCCGQESFTLHSLLGHCCSSLRKHGAWGVAGGSVPVEETLWSTLPSVAWSSPAKWVLPSYPLKKEKTRETVTETICGPQSLKSLLSGLGQKVRDPWVQG